MENNTEMASMIKCNYSYVPTTNEYMAVLGSYGTWLLIMGGLITTGLYILFFEQVFFTSVSAHRVYRRHIYWIASVYPFMTLMSVISVVVPRAHNICTAAKVTYMSVGISHFTDLTVLMFGSEEVMLARTEGEPLNLQVGPVCCCCVCLPYPPVTKFSLRLVMLLSDQLPFTQAAYYLTVLILLSANNITLGNVKPTGPFLWLNLFNMASFMSGVYSLQILAYFSKGHLESYSYKKKSFSMKTLVLVTNLQSLIFDIMANYDAFPCIPPYLPPQVYKQTVENFVYVVEMMVLGTFTFWQYHNDQFLFPNPVNLTQPTNYIDTSSAYSAPCSTSSTSGSGRSTKSNRSTKSTDSITSNFNGINISDMNASSSIITSEAIGSKSPSSSTAGHQSTLYDVREQGESVVSGDAPRFFVHQNGEQERELGVLAVHQPTTGEQRRSEVHEDHQRQNREELVISGEERRVPERNRGAPSIVIHHPATDRIEQQTRFSIT